MAMNGFLRTLCTAICIVFGWLAVQATIYTGTIGSIQWTLDTESGVLTIYGTGNMKNYHGNWDYGCRGNGNVPWYNYRTRVKSVVIEDGVTSIGNAAFYQCTNLTSITMPPSLTKISYEAFRGCSSLEEITIGSGVCTIQDRWVTDCPKLRLIHLEEGNTCFAVIDGIIYTADMETIVKMPDNNPITTYVIPDGVSKMATDAVYSQQNVESITVPVSMTNIDYGVFDNCPKLTTLIFKADTPPTLAKDLYGTSLQFIYVPCDAGSSYTGASGNWGSYSDATGGFTESPVITLNTATNNTELGTVVTSQQADCEHYMAQVQAKPTQHGIFDHWEEDGAGITEDKIDFHVEVNGEYNYTAIFTPKQYTISTAKGTTRINYRDVTSYYTVNGAGTYYYGDTIEISVSIEAGHNLKFSQWDDGNTENPRRVRVTGNKTYSAKLASGKQTITIKSNDTGMGTVSYSPSSNQNKYDYGTQIIATATPKAGYHFTEWSDGCTTLKDTIIAIGDATYVAFFAINTYKITAAPNDEAMGACSGYGTFKTGASTTLEATPNPGYSFVRWNDGNTNRTRTLNNISADADYIAEFAPIPYTITVVSSDNSRGTVSGGGTYDYNTNATIRAVAKTGYHFLNWEDDVYAPAERDVLVLGNATYTANFGLNSYEITATSADNSMGTVSGGGTYDYNSSVTLTATPKVGYHFVAWNDAVATESRSITVTGNASYEATFAINQYTIVFKNDDGTELQSSSYDYLSLPSCETPTKAATAQYTYTFAAWSPTVVNVTADATYTATYNAAVNLYTITFKNEDGTVLQSSQVAYGEKPAYSGATPTKAATAQYTYTFAGWDNAIANVTGEAVYTATYNSTVNQYTVTFKNEDATLQSLLLAYGATPEYSGATPTKASTVQYDYTFDGWTPAITAVSSAAVYSATFASSLREYTVTFKNEDGTVLQSGNVAYGTVPVYSGATPTKSADAQYSYTFNGWNKEIVAVTGAVIYTATYASTVNEYTITFVDDDNSVIQSSKFAYGSTPTCDEPTKESTAQYAYTFNGWTPAIAAVSGEATYKATYASTVRKYAITFKNDDGTVLQSSNVNYGEMPSYSGATPVKSPTAQYTYTFDDWNSEIVEVEGDAIYTATYKETVNKYVVTFKNEDGTVLQSGEIAYGEMPVYSGATPTKSATAQYTYSFAGWNKDIVSVTTATTYTATFESTVNEYLVTFEDEDGTELQSSNVAYGVKPVYSGETPTKAATAQYTYTFNGWDKTIATVTESIVYTATYSATVNQYMISFKNDDGTVLQSTLVDYGTMPSYVGETPTKAATAQYTYTFAGWNNTIVKVEGTADYVAVYTPSVNSYHITFYDEDGTTVLQEKDVAYGETPTCQTPMKAATAQYTYTFDAWTPAIAQVTENASYTASYRATTNSYLVKFVDEDGEKVLQTSNVAYGAMPEYVEATPEKTGTAQYSYSFTGWDKPIVAVTGAVVYTAVYSETMNSYTVVFVDEDLSKLKEQVYEYGATPSCETPSKAATAQYTYVFDGWSPAIGAVTGNITYTATYAAEVNTYDAVFENEDGTELQKSEQLEYGTLPVYSGATPTKAATAQYSYVFKGWNKTIVPITEDVVYTATYTTQTNSYTIVFKNYDGTELQSSEVEYGVIPSYSGAIPTKPTDGVNTYSFAGWNVDPVAVVGDAVYTATFSNATNKYVITFYDEDGETVLQDDEFVYGATPICENPQKAATAEYTYTFNGWSPAIEKVTGTASYVATYRAVKNSYVIDFVDEDGTTILQSSEVEYGEMPMYVEATPTKASTAQYSYLFDGWDSEIEAVTGAATYTATYQATVNEYIIIFKDEDGTELKHYSVKYGEIPSCEEPSKVATAQYTYNFSEWTPAVVAVVGTATYTATYESNVHTYVVTFKNENGDELLKIEDVPYGTTPVYSGATPEKVATEQYEYTFDGWDKTIVPVVGDVTYTATFAASLQKYTIVFKNYDGSELQSSQVEYGTVPVYSGETPTRPANDENTYSFVGWDKALTAVNADAVYVAQYSNSLNSYTITFYDEDGTTELRSMELQYGATPVYTGALPVKPATAEYTYSFDTWIPAIKPVTADASYTAKYSAERNSYVVTFLDEDGETTLLSKAYEYGTTPVYTGATPTKASTAQYSYSFTGWNKPIAAVTGNETYIATFTPMVNSYLVTFENEDGSELQKSLVEYGAMPLYEGETPVKASTIQYSYNFVGWDKSIFEVTENVVYVATYEEVTKKYTISFVNDDDTELQSSEYEYGAMPSYEGETPVKEATAQYTFEFEGWNKTIIPVSGDATYVATYSKTTNSYEITFKNYDGTVLQSSQVAYGEIPSYNGEIPTRPLEAGNNYLFKGWNVPIAPVSAAMEYVATYSDETTTYPISFYDEDGTTLLHTIDFVYGAMPTCSNPTKSDDERYTYTFAAWHPDLHEVDGAESYVASYQAHKKSFTITFVDEDGETVLASAQYEYGAIPSTAVPTKAPTAQYSYSFAGWSPAVVSVTENATYTATYRAVNNSYRITFVDENSNKIFAQDYEYGAMPSCIAPQKDATAQFTYTFNGWSPAVAEVTGTAVYKATYSESVNSYEIVFKNDDGSVLQRSTVAYGAVPQYEGAEPTKSSTAQYSYEFAGWNKTICAVAGEETYVATYFVSTNTYLVTFKNYDGEVLQSSNVAYGTIPSYNEAVPTKPADEEYEYSFVGWNKTIDVVTEDVVYTAVFTKSTNSYTIIFRNYNDTILQTSQFGYGALPMCPIPTRNADVRYTYVFNSWTPELTAVAFDAEYFATYTAITNTYSVTFVDEDGETILQKRDYEYGAMPTYSGRTPTKSSTDQYSYVFNGWDKSIAKVTGEAVYTATFVEVERKYTITFVDDDYSVLSTAEYAYGATPTIDAPEKSVTAQYSYEFKGWTPAISEVVANATYQAEYDAVVNQYVVKFNNADGTELQSSNVSYGSHPVYEGETPTKPSTMQYSYEFAGWNKPLVEVSCDVVYTATFTESVNEYTVIFKNYNGDILQISNVAYGNYPSYEGAIPTKPSENGKDYSFAGWNVVPSRVTDNAVYTAIFTDATTLFEITFVDDDGSVLQQSNFAYGAMPICAVPSKVADAQFTYEFDSWYPKPTIVTEDKTYTATYNSVKKKYVVTFKDDDGTILQSQQYEYGEKPVCVAPTKASTAQYSYIFAGWNYHVIEVSADAVYTATYTQSTNQYTVSFLDDDNSLITSVTYDYGQMPSAENPTKASTDQYDYSFEEWTPSLVEVTADASYKASYSATERTYSVVFANEDGTELQRTNETYGAYPVYVGETPQKEGNAQYSYEFAGWNKTIVAVMGNTTYSAVFTQVTNKYVVTFKDEDGTVLQSSEMPYGAYPSYENPYPTKVGDEGATYTFAGWNAELVKVTANVEYVATYTTETNVYQITFKNYNDQILQRTDVPYGAMPTCFAPTRVADAQFSYEFDSWSPDLIPVERAATYYAVFKEHLNMYSVKFVDEEGTVLEGSGVYGYGEKLSVVAPSKPATEQYVYTFIGWDKPVEIVTADVVYTARFSQSLRKYAITFENENGEKLSASGEYEYGSLPTCNAPAKPANEQFSYSFEGWNPAITPVKAVATYRPQYSATANTYAIVFVDEDGTELQNTQIAYGEMPEYHGAVPTKTASERESFAFVGWNKTIVPVVGDETYTAMYESIAKTYIIVFKNEDGSILQQSSCEYGVVPSYDGALPQKPNDVGNVYTFAGWNVTPVKVVGDAVYTATYMLASDMYVITFVDEDGTILQQTEFNYRSVPTCPIPTKLADDKYSYLFETWSPDLQPVTTEATYTAVYAKTPKTYVVNFMSEDGATVLLKQMAQYGEMPTFTEEIPVKAGNEQYSYSFCCWSPELETVTGNATYTITYNTMVNQYVVSFKNYDGVVLQVSVLNYGDMPLYDGETPMRATDAASSYTFKGWDHDISPVTKTETYVAQYAVSPAKYSVTATANNVAYGYVEGGGMYDYNYSLELRAVENYGYRFVRWSDGVMQNPRQLTVLKNYTVEALFEPIQYSISIAVNNSNFGYIEGGYDLYDFNSEVTVEAVPNEGYEFYQWANGSKNTQKTFVMNGDMYDTAYFKPKTFIVSAMTNDVLMGTVAGVGSYNYNSMVTLTAEPREGFSFVKWDDGNTNATRKFVIVSDTTFMAVFKPIQYTVTLTVNDENYGEVFGAGVYNINADTVIEARCKYGYEFVEWSDGVVDMSRRIVVVEDTTYEARFKPIVYELSLYSSDESMGSVDGSGSYEYGSDVEITAVPEKGYRFASWSDGDTVALRTYRIKASANLVANFVPIEYEVRLSVNDSYFGTVEGAGLYSYQSDAELIANPIYGYKLGGWSTGQTTDTINITVLSDTLIIANFVPEQYQLTLKLSDDSAGVVTGDGIFDFMQVAVVSVQAAEGYEFIEWSDGNTDTVRNIMMTKDVELEARFRKIENIDLQLYTIPHYIVLKYVKDYDIYIINPIGEIARFTSKSPDINVQYYMPTMGVYIVKLISPEGAVQVRKVFVR